MSTSTTVDLHQIETFYTALELPLFSSPGKDIFQSENAIEDIVDEQQNVSHPPMPAPSQDPITMPKTSDEPPVPLQIVFPDGVTVIPKIEHTKAQERANRLRARAIRIRMAIGSFILMVIILIIGNIVIQMIINPDLSLYQSIGMFTEKVVQIFGGGN